QAHVGEDQESEVGFTNRRDGALYNAVSGERAAAPCVFCLRQAEENDAGKTELLDFAALFDDLIGRLLVDAGHGADFLADSTAGAHKHGVDQAGGTQSRLAHQAAQRLAAAKTARAFAEGSHGLAPRIFCEAPRTSPACRAATMDSSEGSSACTER